MTSVAWEVVEFCGPSYRLRSMNIWCLVHQSSTLKRNLYSLQMLVFLWLALITKKIKETELETGACPCSPSDTWQRLLCGGQWLWSFKHPSVLSLPFFFVIPPLGSSFLIFSQADIDVIHCLSFQDHFGLKEINGTRQISIFSYLFVYFPKPDYRFV